MQTRLRCRRSRFSSDMLSTICLAQLCRRPSKTKHLDRTDPGREATERRYQPALPQRQTSTIACLGPRRQPHRRTRSGCGLPVLGNHGPASRIHRRTSTLVHPGRRRCGIGRRLHLRQHLPRDARGASPIAAPFPTACPQAPAIAACGSFRIGIRRSGMVSHLRTRAMGRPLPQRAARPQHRPQDPGRSLVPVDSQAGPPGSRGRNRHCGRPANHPQLRHLPRNHRGAASIRFSRNAVSGPSTRPIFPFRTHARGANHDRTRHLRRHQPKGRKRQDHDLHEPRRRGLPGRKEDDDRGHGPAGFVRNLERSARKAVRPKASPRSRAVSPGKSDARRRVASRSSSSTRPDIPTCRC